MPDGLAGLIAKLHAKDPAARFQSAAEVAEVLGRHLAHVHHPSVVPLAIVSKGIEGREPAAPAASHPPARRRWAAAAVVLVATLAVLGAAEAAGVTNVRATVIRIFTPEGTLVVEADDPAVRVTVEGDGNLVITGAGPREVRLKAGSYRVRAMKDGKPVKLDRDLVTISRDDTQVVRVRVEGAAPAAVALTPEQVRERQAAEVLLRRGATVTLMSDDFKNDVLKKPGQAWPAGAWHVHEVGATQNPALTPADLAALREFPRLRGLNLTNSPVTIAAVLDQIEGGRLAELRLSGVPTTSEDVARLAKIKTLSAVFLYGTGVSDDDDARLATLPLLNDVNVGGNAITDESLKHLTRLPLSRLYVSRTRVTDVGLALLRPCKNLALLKVTGTGVTAEGVADLRKALPKCEVVWDNDAGKSK